MDLRGMHVRERKGKRGRSWQIIIEQSPCPDTGKRRRVFKSVSNVTKKQAEKMGMQIMQDLETDSYVKSTTMTVEKYFREWYDTYIVPYKSPTTAATYLYNLESYIFPRFGKLKLQGGLTTIEIQRWINELSIKSPISDNPLSPKSIRNLYMNLNAGLKRAVILGYIVKNPAEHIELPKCKPVKPEVYNAAELQKLLEVAQDTDLMTGLMLLCCLGIRRSEALALLWTDIDFDNGLVSITKGVVRVKSGESVTKSPKSDAGTRIIPAPAVLIDFLRRERVEYLTSKLRYGAMYHDNNLIVCQPNGEPYTGDYFSQKFRRLLADNQLKKIRLHDLRHSHITYLLNLGINVKVIQSRAGHSTINTTLDTYSHVLDDMGREAADTLNDGLQSIVARVL
ncbi:MAG: site-specific integrase [Defluviitaleaceae bacterium]|nr:site-specific integrase [Defluviitaleaceae bacterium]